MTNEIVIILRIPRNSLTGQSLYKYADLDFDILDLIATLHLTKVFHFVITGISWISNSYTRRNPVIEICILTSIIHINGKAVHGKTLFDCAITLIFRERTYMRRFMDHVTKNKQHLR